MKLLFCCRPFPDLWLHVKGDFSLCGKSFRQMPYWYHWWLIWVPAWIKLTWYWWNLWIFVLVCLCAFCMLDFVHMLLCIGYYDYFFQCFDTVGLGGQQEGHPACEKLCFDLFMVSVWLELCTSCSSSCHRYLHYPQLQQIRIQRHSSAG